jgi:hypothetical protein
MARAHVGSIADRGLLVRVAFRMIVAMAREALPHDPERESSSQHP